jgi:hypothetical protein
MRATYSAKHAEGCTQVCWPVHVPSVRELFTAHRHSESELRLLPRFLVLPQVYNEVQHTP